MIVVVDYGMGNSGSVLNMIRKIGVAAVVSSRKADIAHAEKLVMPGVGAFDAGMAALERTALRDVIEQAVLGDGKPMLGICLGMQLLMERSEEGSRNGLGWIAGEAIRFPSEFEGKAIKIPHMGWNKVRWREGFGLATELGDRERFYFVHSYRVVCRHAEDIAGTTNYAGEFASAIARRNIYGVQFHPEKSHRYGMQLLRKFVLL